MCLLHVCSQTISENALKRIGCYLKGTLDKGLILTPSDDLKIDCYPDADFAGLWNRDNKNDPHCIRSQTGYVICLTNCPVLWISKLQTEIALSTMEAEYVALSASCRDLFGMIDVTNKICSALHLTLSDTTEMHVKIHKDNVGTLILGQLEPRQMTPPLITLCSEISLVSGTPDPSKNSFSKNCFNRSTGRYIHKRA
jgi:hypothetical protein